MLKQPVVYPRNLFVLTDGVVLNSSEISQLIEKYSNTTRVFALGIGKEILTRILSEISYQETLKAKNLLGRLASPVTVNGTWLMMVKNCYLK